MKSSLFSKPLFYVLLLLLIIGILGPPNTAEGFQGSDCELSPAEFKEKSKNTKMFTLFYANWCGHCKNMKPQWEAAANKVNTGQDKKMVMVNVGDQDDASQEQLRKEYNIRGYPTIVDIDGGKQVGEYSGDRNENAFVKHAYSFTS
jgi:thiol-disulfide isomerase/thioredoxin